MVVTAKLRHEDGSVRTLVLPVLDEQVGDLDIADALCDLGWQIPEPWTLVSVERTAA